MLERMSFIASPLSKSCHSVEVGLDFIGCPFYDF
jgi:hypothetical protein